MKEIKFSIIIPIYNTKQYLKKCIDSILEQSYDNYEIIAVNDGSTDNSLQYLQELYNDNEKIKIYSKKNSGVSDTRNFAIDKSSGEWLVFLDSDDWIENETLSTLNKIILSDNDIEAISSPLYINKNEKEYKKNITEQIIENNKYEVLSSILSDEYTKGTFFKDFGNIRGIGGKVYKSELIKKEKIKFDLRFSYFEDGIFNYKAMEKAKKIIITNFSFYHYRIIPTSATKRYNVEKYYNNNELIRELKKLSKNNKHTENSYNYACFELLRTLTNNIIKTYRLKNFKQGLLFLKKAITKFLDESDFQKIEFQKLKTESKIYYLLLKTKMYIIIYILYILKN